MLELDGLIICKREGGPYCIWKIHTVSDYGADEMCYDSPEPLPGTKWSRSGQQRCGDPSQDMVRQYGEVIGIGLVGWQTGDHCCLWFVLLYISTC